MTSATVTHALEGSESAVYVTHDYLSMSFDKHDHLKAVAKSAKIAGVKKLIAVCPIEHDMYYSENYEDPLKRRIEAEAEAF